MFVKSSLKTTVLSLLFIIVSLFVAHSKTLAAQNWQAHAGTGLAGVAVMKFYPKTITIDEGDSITWTNHDSMLPHTISFPGADGTIPESFDPAGGSTYNGSIFTSSGILLPSQTYTLKFTKAGKYNYECLLHDEFGMEASVIVLKK